MQEDTFLLKIKTFFTIKKIIWTVIILAVLFGVWFIFIRESTPTNIQSVVIKKQDVEKTVLTTGQVVSSTDLSLSFQTSGFVRRINVKEGDVVRGGVTLAVLDQGNAIAQLESAKGSLAQARANYEKIRSAATTQDIAVSQATLNSALTTLENAKQNLINQLSTSFNSANTSLLSYTNILFSNPQSNNPQFGISGTIQTNIQAVTTVNNDRIAINAIIPVWQNEISAVSDSNIEKVVDDSIKNLTTISNYLSNIINILTVYTQVTAGGSQTALTTYQSGVATAKSTIDTLVTSLITYRQTVRSANSAYLQAKASLELKQSPARPEDISIAEAQVISAQGQVNLAEVNLRNTTITAPTAGTITVINIKLGELASASKEVMKLLNVRELHTEASVSEADIASIVVGQTIDYTFDALGPDRHFKGKVLTINPASTVVSGVVNYKVTGSLEDISEIKPGMTANMTILVNEKKDILVTPSSSIINRDGKKFVRVIDDVKTKSYQEVEVETGLDADGGLVEITSGLMEGKEVVTFIK